MSHLFPERIETERLELVAIPAASTDVLDLYRIASGQEGDDMETVTEYLTWDPHETPKETLEFVEAVTEKRRNEDGSEYAIYPKEGDRAGEFAGMAGVGVDWDRRTAGFGTWLREPFWGRGYSGERAAAFVDLAFQHLDLELVAVSHEVGNEKSRRAIEKYVEAHGGRREGILRNQVQGSAADPVDVVRYTVAREEYEAATADRERRATWTMETGESRGEE